VSNAVPRGQVIARHLKEFPLVKSSIPPLASSLVGAVLATWVNKLHDAPLQISHGHQVCSIHWGCQGEDKACRTNPLLLA